MQCWGCDGSLMVVTHTGVFKYTIHQGQTLDITPTHTYTTHTHTHPAPVNTTCSGPSVSARALSSLLLTSVRAAISVTMLSISWLSSDLQKTMSFRRSPMFLLVYSWVRRVSCSRSCISLRVSFRSRSALLRDDSDSR